MNPYKTLRSVIRFGRASVAWDLGENGLHVDVDVPPTTSATVTLPGRPPVRVGSGNHSFS